MILLLTFQILLLIYHLVILWVELPPFNRVENFSFSERILESLLHTSVYMLAILSVYFGWADVQNGMLLFYFALFGVGIMVWWIPFIVGPGRKWKEQYSKLFSLQRKVFNTSRAVVPTLEVSIQHLLLLVITIAFICFRLKLIQ